MPAYYLHYAAPRSTGWQEAKKYRITEENILKILGYYPMREEEILLELLGAPSTPTPAKIWQSEHELDARRGHTQLYPLAKRLEVGLCVNADLPWLAATPDDLLEDGIVKYSCPFSQVLYRTIPAAIEISMATQLGVMEFTRPHAEVQVWTPAASLYRKYSEGDLLQRLWEEFIQPRVVSYYHSTLVPALAQRGISTDQIYQVNQPEYLPVERGMTLEQIVKL